VSDQLHAPATTRCPLDRRLGEPQSQSGHGGEEKNPYPCQDSNPVRSLVCILYITGIDVHLLQLQIQYCKANRATDFTLRGVRSCFLLFRQVFARACSVELDYRCDICRVMKLVESSARLSFCMCFMLLPSVQPEILLSL
jgi:hypothetical protein